MLRTYVAALGHRPRLRQIDAPGEPPERLSDLLLVCIPRYSDLSGLDRQVRRLPSEARSSAQVIVLRAHPREAARILRQAGPHESVDLLHRRSNVPIMLVHYADGEHHLTPLTPDAPAFDAAVSAALIRQLRFAELRTYADEPGAILPKSSTFHYLGPNGKHYRAFLRVGTALQSEDTLDAVAFWLLPLVRPNTVLVVDSATITVIGLHLGQYIREENLAGDRSVHSVHSMRGYRDDDGDTDDLHHRLTSVVPDRVDREHAMVLVSILSTGGLALLGKAAVSEAGFAEVITVALYGPPQERPQSADDVQVNDVLSAVPADLDRAEPADCPACKPSVRGGSPAIPIAADSYTLQVAQTVVAAEINVAAVSQVVDLLSRYPNSGAFSAHRTERRDGRNLSGRHHAVYIDVGELLKMPAFINAVRGRAEPIRGRVDAILAPNHPAARAMVDIVQPMLGVPAVVCDAEALPRLNAEQRAVISQPRLLIVDDVVITGDRLRGFRGTLGTLKITHDEVHMLVGVARPTTEQSRLGIVNVLHQMGRREKYFHPVEELLLPHWEQDECPWCWEGDALAPYGAGRGETMTAAVLERFEALQRPDRGLIDNLFWSWTGEPFTLGPNSVLGSADLNQAEIFTAVASGIQTLRSNGNLDEEFTPPVSKVLDSDFWERGRFYASPILAAILRATRRHDLLAPVPGSKFIHATDALFTAPAWHVLRAELLFALAAGKLPATEGALDALTDGHGDEGAIKLFEKLLPTIDSDIGDSSPSAPER